MSMVRKMKNSGVDWIKSIPSNWNVVPLKILFSFGKGLSITKADLVEEGYAVISYGQIHSKKNSGTSITDELIRYIPSKLAYTQSRVKKGNFIFADTSEDLDGCGNCVYVDRECELFAGYHTIILRQKNQINDNRYIAYLFRTDCWRRQIRTEVNGVKLFSISQNILRRTSLIVPPLLEQKAIADFLDAKCAEIDGMLADLDVEIKMLAEYKKSIIAETVTRGLNPNVPMKQSEIPWAKTIPAHWTTIRGKYAFRLLQRPVKEDDGVVTCFRDGQVTLRSNRREDGFTMSDKEYGYQGIEPGDLVVHGMDGFAGSIGISDSRGKGTPVLNVLDSDHNKRYLMYYLRNMAYGNVFLALSTGIRVRSCDLSWKKLGEIRIVLPPIEEQNAIADYIDHKLEEVQDAIATKQTQIDTLKSYKASLIYEYVTGKKQVI